MKRQFLILGFFFFSMAMIAQTTDPVIMQINGKDIKKSEFEYIYKKNNNEQVIDQKTLLEYVELFKNFKLKVAEAETQGIDTTQAFLKELNEYRAQLAKPYVSEMPIDEDLVKMLYERSKEFVEVSHLMLNIPKKTQNEEAGRPGPFFPADTLEVYKVADAIYKRILKGEKFEKLVQEFSNDERSRTAKQPGLLGWASIFQLPGALEDVMFNTPVGKVSRPVQSAFGYHLLKVNARQQDPGFLLNASHILIMVPQGADTVAVTDAINKIDSIYRLAVNGEDFAELARQYSDDKGSGSRGGNLSWFGFGAMVPEFQNAAFALQNPGDISKPVRSQFGFHIIKLIDKKPIPSFEEKRAELISRIERSDRAMALNRPAIEKMKKNSGFSPNESAYKALMEKANTVFPTDEAFIAAFENDESVLFLAGNTPYKISNFIVYLKANLNSNFNKLSTAFLQEKLRSFEHKSLLSEEDRGLENRHPDFKNLMNEYRDGILLFEVSNNEVWDKASKDTTGLETFFSNNRADYAWEKPHFKGFVVHCKDEKAMKTMKKQIAKMNSEDAAKFLYATYGGTGNLRLERVLCAPGGNAFVDQYIFKTGTVAKPAINLPVTFIIGKILNAPEEYTDVRGLVITDYQNYLENEWISTLNKKYPVIIYEDVVNSVK